MQIIIRMCTDEMEVSEYWHNINASLDLDMRVLDDVEGNFPPLHRFSTAFLFHTLSHLVSICFAHSTSLSLTYIPTYCNVPQRKRPKYKVTIHG